jgi:hypothetical protein
MHPMLPESEDDRNFSYKKPEINGIINNYRTYAGSERSRNGECRFGVVDTKIGLFSQCSSRNGGLSNAQLHLSLDIVDKWHVKLGVS